METQEPEPGPTDLKTAAEPCGGPAQGEKTSRVTVKKRPASTALDPRDEADMEEMERVIKLARVEAKSKVTDEDGAEDEGEVNDDDDDEAGEEVNAPVLKRPAAKNNGPPVQKQIAKVEVNEKPSALSQSGQEAMRSLMKRPSSA